MTVQDLRFLSSYPSHVFFFFNLFEKVYPSHVNPTLFYIYVYAFSVYLFQPFLQYETKVMAGSIRKFYLVI